MTDMLSSLLTQLVLTFVALVSYPDATPGTIRGAGLAVEPLPATVVPAERPCSVDRTAAGRGDCDAAARMRWQVTMPLPALRRCGSGCDAG